jgi:hypothetical protein
VSGYTPQVGEQSAEMLTADDRRTLARDLPDLAARYPKFVFHAGLARAFLNPPRSPHDCLFAKMSANYSADLRSRVEPCVFGGNPDCSQCGCAASTGLHWVRGLKVAGGLKVDHFVGSSVKFGRMMSQLRSRRAQLTRWTSRVPT